VNGIAAGPLGACIVNARIAGPFPRRIDAAERKPISATSAPSQIIDQTRKRAVIGDVDPPAVNLRLVQCTVG
jgi:hypothetical protein